ncbi:MAG: cyclic di-GMP phosphodiesterase [Thermoleophilaceae bacterium]|jgi:putative two-component system response regulator|nr:cyclic di-GMP phosphodiesterase [Thermoleophilaceae bacterium]
MPATAQTVMTPGDATSAGQPTLSRRILVVDDDPRVGRVLTTMLAAAGYDVRAVMSAREARAALAGDEIGLLLSDVKMPGESGLELIRFALAEHPDTATLLISGDDNPEIARVGLAYGAYGYLTKPFARNQIVIAVMNAFRRRELEIRDRGARDELGREVDERTAELRDAMSNLTVAGEQVESSRAETIYLLARAAEFRDTGTGAHLDRMSGYCGLMAGRLGLDPALLTLASVLHDIGKIATPDAVLLKPGRLTRRERLEIERHAMAGHELLEGSSSDVLRLAASIALTHHEKFDGSGYPNGLAGHDIPLEGRIAAVADVFDALTSHRVYREAWSLDRTLAELEAQRDKHFDGDVLDAFADALPEILALRETSSRS